MSDDSPDRPGPRSGPAPRPTPDLTARVEDERLHGELRARLFGEPRRVVRIGGYEVLRKLGQGGSGAVFAVRDDEGRSRALKLVHSNDPRSLARLRREGRAMSALVHPHIVRVHDTGTHDDVVYVVLDLVEGVTLRTWVQAGKPWVETLTCLLPVLDGLAAAHARGILHRDLKPENILVEAPAHAWLLDFGLALPLPGSEAQELTHMSQALTRTGAILGTVGYIAPEHLMGQPIDARADQFSICVVLWEALHGQRPFTGATADAIGLAALHGQIQDPPPDEVPAAVDAVLRRGLGAKPEDRHASVRALADALRGAMAQPEDTGGWFARWRSRGR